MRRRFSRCRRICVWPGAWGSSASSWSSPAPTGWTIRACSTPWTRSTRRCAGPSFTSMRPTPKTPCSAAGMRRVCAALRPKIMRTADICRELGWHLDLLLPGWLITELMPTLRELPVGFTVAHMGLFPARNGVTQPGFQEFLALANDGSKRCWVKLTGIYRFSEDPTFADVKPFAQALIATVPDQLIWGSDFPHLSFHERVGTIQLYNLLLDWAPDPGMRKRILTDNPARLFEFAYRMRGEP